jgi:hypothetical protein
MKPTVDQLREVAEYLVDSALDIAEQYPSGAYAPPEPWTLADLAVAEYLYRAVDRRAGKRVRRHRAKEWREVLRAHEEGER